MKSNKTGHQGYYAVERILDVRKRGKSKQYLVHWQDYDIMEASWEPLAHLKFALNQVKVFEESLKAKQLADKSDSEPQEVNQTKKQRKKLNSSGNLRGLKSKQRKEQEQSQQKKRRRASSAEKQIQKVQLKIKKKRGRKPSQVKIQRLKEEEALSKKSSDSFALQNQIRSSGVRSLDSSQPSEKNLKLPTLQTERQDQKQRQNLKKIPSPKREKSKQNISKKKTTGQQNQKSKSYSEKNQTQASVNDKPNIEKRKNAPCIKKSSKIQQKKIQSLIASIQEQDRQDEITGTPSDPKVPSSPNKFEIEETVNRVSNKNAARPKQAPRIKEMEPQAISLTELNKQLPVYQFRFPNNEALQNPITPMKPLKPQEPKVKLQDTLGIPRGIKFIKFEDGQCKYSVKYSTGCKIIMSSEMAQQRCLHLLLAYLENRNSDRLSK